MVWLFPLLSVHLIVIEDDDTLINPRCSGVSGGPENTIFYQDVHLYNSPPSMTR